MESVLKLFKREIQISSFNLTEDELLVFIAFWESNKYLKPTEFVKELYGYIGLSVMFKGCTIDLSTNEVSLSRRTII